MDTHPTLIYCRSRQHVLGSLVANLHQYDLAAPEAADAVAHINDLLRVDGGIVTPIYYWTCINTEIAPSHPSSIRSSSTPARTRRSGLLFVATSTRCFSAW